MFTPQAHTLCPHNKRGAPSPPPTTHPSTQTSAPSLKLLAAVSPKADSNGEFWYDRTKMTTVYMQTAAVMRGANAHMASYKLEGICPACAVPHKGDRFDESCPKIKELRFVHRRKENQRVHGQVSAGPSSSEAATLGTIVQLNHEADGLGQTAFCRNFRNGHCRRGGKCSFMHKKA